MKKTCIILLSVLFLVSSSAVIAKGKGKKAEVTVKGMVEMTKNEKGKDMFTFKAEDGTEYAVTVGKKVKDFAMFAGKSVELTGTAKDAKGKKTFTVSAVKEAVAAEAATEAAPAAAPVEAAPAPAAPAPAAPAAGAK